MVGTPAATAERTPVGESSMATQRETSDAERGGCSEVGLRVRLAVADLVPGDDRREAAVGKGGDDRIGERAPGHRHQGTRDAGLDEGEEEVPCPWTPGHEAPDPVDDPAQELVDDPLGRSTRPVSGPG